MTEDNFEEFLKKAAQGYNAPPIRTPRDEMWSAIQAKRAAGPRVVYGGGGLLRDLSERRFSSKFWLGAAAAALFLVATGVGIGRWTAPPGTQSVAATNPLKTVPPPSTTQQSAPNPSTDNAGTVVTNPAARNQSGRSSVLPSPNTHQYRIDSGGGNGTRVAVGESSSTTTAAYQLAAVRHLSEAEALLTSFRTRSATDQQMDAQLGSWARELLSNTRLLLDSPVANDPQRRPLLEDLELVLVQIVQLSPGSTPQDRELIEKTLQHDHVMTRLRTAIPAGSQRGS